MNIFRKTLCSTLQLVGGKRCIVGKRMKTDTDYYIPVSEWVWALMDKYNGIVMPLSKLDDYNPLLRQTMLILGITSTARKTFADWCINEFQLSEEATIVAMGQIADKELTPYRKTRPKRLLSEFPAELLQAKRTKSVAAAAHQPFIQIH